MRMYALTAKAAPRCRTLRRIVSMPARCRSKRRRLIMVTSIPLIPRQVLFGNPERISPRIAPDGKRMAWIAPRDGVLNVWVAPVGDLGEAEVVTDDRDRGIRAYFWAHDGRHLLYVQDKGGDENWRLYAVDLQDGGVRDLTPFDEVQGQVIEGIGW